MPRKTTVKVFPFLEGQHQEVDARVLPDGYLSACKNVRLRKDGRFGVRADFTAIGNDTGATADLVPRDLVGFGDALCSLGDSGGISSDTAIWDIHDYSGVTPAEWTPSAGTNPSADTLLRLSQVTNLRTFAAYNPALLGATFSVTRIDCAAGGGVVCAAYTDSSTSYFHFFRASTGSTIFETTLAGDRPRVVAVGTTFFILAFDAAAGIVLSKYDPTTDTTATVLTAPSVAALNCYDVVPNRALNGFWVVFNTTGPLTRIVPYNSSGVASTAIVGPAVTYAHVSAVETATRVHLVTVTAVPVGELYSYTLAGVLSTGPTALSTSPLSQAAIVDSTFAGTEQVTIYMDGASAVRSEKFVATTHVTAGALSASLGFFGAKPLLSGTPNYHAITGAVVNDGSFFSSFLKSVFPSGFNQPPTLGALTSKFGAAKVSSNHIPKIAKDASTGKFYWPTLTVNDQSISRPSVSEFDFLSSDRRQTTQIAGLLYIGGGAPGVYDTRLLCQAGVFLKPRIISATASNGAGSLPSAVSLLTAIVSEGRDAYGNIVQGDISEVSTVAMGGADDTITLSISGDLGLPVSDRVFVGYRSISGINQLRRAETTTSSSLVYLANDATVGTHGIIYTQAGRGAISGTTPQEAPFPADYLWKWGSRILAANADQAFVSREIFPGEQATWSQAVGFTIPKISERIKGVAALDQRGFLFTSERIYWFSGDGPNDAGEGRYSEPLPLPTSTGLEDWRSLVETPLGIFFQGSNGQLWVLPRDGSPPVWIGQPVRDTLVSFPTVTSATLVTDEQLVSFTCNNTGLTDARIVSYDLRAKTWIVDEFGSSTPITAACSYQGRLAMISAGIVYTEKTTLTPTTFIEHGLTTGTIKPFDWGKIVRFGVIGEYRGDCDVYARISHDDGKSFTTMTKVQQLRAATYTAGDTVDIEWTPSRWKTDGFRLDFSARTPGSATEGLVFNEYWIEYLPGRGGSRRASGQRG